MTVNMNVALLSDESILPTAPLIEGAACAQLFNENPPRGDFGSSLIGRYGIRITLPAPISFSGSDYISFYYGPHQYSPGSELDTVANGGVRVIFVDSAGAYAGYNLYGQISGYEAAGVLKGWLASYSVVNTTFNIAKGRTPDISSGTINWASIVAVECTVKTTAASRKDIRLGKIARRSAPLITGTETFKSLSAAAKAMAEAVLDPLVVSYAPLYFGGSDQTAVGLRLGLTVGNGSITTTFTESKFALGFENSFEFFPAASTIGPWTQLPDDRKRELLFNQSATDTLSLTDGSIASAGWWQWALQGSGVATCTRIQFWRFNGFRAAHGVYAGCIWTAGDTAVEVTLATTISEGVIRDAVTTGLKIIDVAGDYSGIDVQIDGASATYDIELGAGGAGTYSLPHISVPDGYTLRLHNDSTTNAVVVELPLGLAYSTSTAGGAITVDLPAVSVSVEAPALIAGSRVQLYNITDSVEVLNTELAGVGLTFTSPYTGNKVIRLRADHASKLPLETAGVLTASGLTFLDVQADDDVYLGNGIDGSAVTEFAPDGANLEVDIDDPDGVTNVQRLYAWLQWYMTTEDGIRSDFFGAVSAIDNANYQIDQSKADIRLDNVSAMPVRVIGGNLTRRDGSTVIATTSGSIQMDPGKAYAIETGVSGLTPDESSKLNQISLLALETTAQAAATAAGVAASESAEAVGNTLTLLSQPAPSAGVVAAAVWADPTAASFALESTALGIAAAVDALPPPPSVAGLALETTAQAILEEAAAAATDAAAILALPAPPTAAELTAEVWTDPAATGLARETTAQAAVNNAAMAAALSA